MVLIQNLKEHWRKYVVVALVTASALLFVLEDFSHRVHVFGLVNESLLHLSPRNVRGDGLRGRSRLPDSTSTERGSIPEAEDVPQPYIPPEAEVVITPKDTSKTLDEVVNVRVTKTFGFTRQPGLDVNLLPLGIGLDFKGVYAYRFGGEIGLDKFLGNYNGVSPTLGISYRLDRFSLLRNTELKVSYAPIGPLPVQIGLRWSL